MEKMAICLCFNPFNLLRAWWVLAKLDFYCLDRALWRNIPDRANMSAFNSNRGGLHSRGNILALRSVFSNEGKIYDRRHTPTTAPIGDSGSRIVSVRPEEAA